MKAAIYLESLQLILESMIPNQINTVSDITLTLAQILLNFAFYAFDWKSGSLCSLLPFISLIAKRCVFYSEVETKHMLLIGVLSLVWLSMQLVVLEMIITKVGKMFVETEIFQ